MCIRLGSVWDEIIRNPRPEIGPVAKGGEYEKGGVERLEGVAYPPVYCATFLKLK